MDSVNGPSLIWGVTMLVILIGSLAARRLPLGQVARYLLAWIAIFAVVYGLFLYRQDIAAIWERARSDLMGGSQQAVSGSAMELRRIDGHFVAEASINGRPVEFLVDSGASVTTISPETARAIGLNVERSGFPIVVQTANGLANSWPMGRHSIAVGSIVVSDVDLHMSEQAGSTNLLGMNWLNRLSSWEVSGDRMILRP